MKSTPENKIKQLGCELLDEYGVFHYAVAAGPYSTSGITDRVACFHGRYCGIEFKAPGKKPTALQKLHMEGVKKAGGACFVVDGPESLEAVREWIHRVLDDEAPKESHDSFEVQFLAARVRRVAGLLGLANAIPEEDESLAACAGTVLGTVAREIEALLAKQTPAEPHQTSSAYYEA